MKLCHTLRFLKALRSTESFLPRFRSTPKRDEYGDPLFIERDVILGRKRHRNLPFLCPRGFQPFKEAPKHLCILRRPFHQSGFFGNPLEDKGRVETFYFAKPMTYWHEKMLRKVVLIRSIRKHEDEIESSRDPCGNSHKFFPYTLSLPQDVYRAKGRESVRSVEIVATFANHYDDELRSFKGSIPRQAETPALRSRGNAGPNSGYLLSTRYRIRDVISDIRIHSSTFGYCGQFWYQFDTEGPLDHVPQQAITRHQTKRYCRILMYWKFYPLYCLIWKPLACCRCPEKGYSRRNVPHITLLSSRLETSVFLSQLAFPPFRAAKLNSIPTHPHLVTCIV
ncbi:uncharacterized protein BDR25DRAFT_348056 [Lindgomyces ingoldianus]|uniref:Uncharacterized protein n=1 Tax=Lindgomyces ingoldianus TaxID=673940 RepID=A0ACB6REF7_9PLEO|nr:uncharacterized protein BDR25DRAFT_348056 [Lindgomyces ingoldianus]KAF2477739.1 hypothetical protein BDR25DRAFT_348056 [Lindgomyces ingoldianus]